MAKPTTSEKGSFLEALAEIPPTPSRYFQKGFDVLLELSSNNTKHAIEYIIDNIEKGGGFVESAEFAEKVGVSKENARNISFSLATIASILVSAEGTPDDFISAAIANKLLNQEQSERALNIVNAIVIRKKSLSEGMKRQTLASEILPSLISFDLTTELRLGFEEKEIKRAVPIAVFHVDTDSYEQEIWFQATKSQIEDIIKKLKICSDNIEKAESWINIQLTQD